jgi:dipeptidyl-peptidase-3
MDETTLKQYLADDPPTIARLEIKPHFEKLSVQEKKYAHFLSRASFAGTRVNLRQVSPESESIFDFIQALHVASGG